MIPHFEFCGRCGWRKGGLGSWNGRACKCGHSGTPQTTCKGCGYTGLVAGKVCASCNGSGLVPMGGAR
jgi:hypothetical protein